MRMESAIIVLRLTGVVLTVIAGSTTGFLFLYSWFLVPGDASPWLELARCSVIFPIATLALTIAAAPLGRFG